MKLTNLIASAGILLAVGAHAATINFNNFSFNGTDVVLFDNAGVPLTAGSVELYTGVAPTTLVAAALLSGPTEVFAVSAISPGGGLIASAWNQDNEDDSFTGVNLFMLFVNETRTQFGAYDMATEFGPETPSAPFTANELINAPSLLTLQGAGSGENPNIDFSAIGAGTAPGYELRLDAIPEPSTSLLAGFAGLALLIRRKR